MDHIERRVARGLFWPIIQNGIRFNKVVRALYFCCYCRCWKLLTQPSYKGRGCLVIATVTVDCSGHVGANKSPNYICIGEGTNVVDSIG
jgi:hypothetical protein